MNSFTKTAILSLMMNTALAQGQSSYCMEHCNEPFGNLLGQSFLTKAYSNCNGDCVSNESNELLIPELKNSVFTGMKWQCVEYARRWWIENKRVTFGDVAYAYNIWDLPSGETVDGHSKVVLQKFKNKETKEAPQVGDLLINSVALAITGHVSVVIGVEEDSILIGEQNYFNRSWEGKNYSRRLLLDKDSQGRYRVIDDSLIGWVRAVSSEKESH